MTSLKRRPSWPFSSGCQRPGRCQNALLNVSYDVAREFYKDYNAAFAHAAKKTTGQDVKINQSHRAPAPRPGP